MFGRSSAIRCIYFPTHGSIACFCRQTQFSKLRLLAHVDDQRGLHNPELTEDIAELQVWMLLARMGNRAGMYVHANAQLPMHAWLGRLRTCRSLTAWP